MAKPKQTNKQTSKQANKQNQNHKTSYKKPPTLSKLIMFMLKPMCVVANAS